MPQLPYNWQMALGRVNDDMRDHQVYVGDPVFIRIFKEENILELWMRGEESYKYTLVKTYPICNWSGSLGPKIKEGDRQAPEGFYETYIASLNPQSQYHVSFNINFPNEYDRAYGRTGSFLMIHGDCVSDGCYAMNNAQIEEIYTLVERSLDNGQRRIPIHIFPFRMTGARMVQEIQSPWFNFWLDIKDGYDYFETHKRPPLWTVQDKDYVFY
jgi:murein L,D-transpeptidase YafK